MKPRFIVCFIVLAMFVLVPPVDAEEVRGSILKIEDGKVTFKTVIGQRNLELSKNCTVWMYSKDRTKRKIEEGLKAEILQGIDEKKGLPAILDVPGKKVDEIWILETRKKPK